MLAAADVLLLNQRPGMKNMAFPSKITSYVFSGTPIIAAAESDSDTAQELVPASAAYLVEPGDPVALLDGIRELRADRDLRLRLASSAHEHGRRHITAEAALEQWEDFALRLTGMEAREPVLLERAA